MGRWVEVEKKKGGGRRRLYIPSAEEKRAARKYMRALYFAWYELMRENGLYAVVHGFVPNHSPMTNAACHLGQKTVISLDIENFFDSCSVPLFEKALKYIARATRQRLLCDEARSVLFVGGIPAQGLPTSPAVANICFALADDQLVWFAKTNRLVYSRYADDLTFSSSRQLDANKVRDIIEGVRVIVGRWGFRLNMEKIDVQYSARGNPIVCGVSVGPKGLGVPRRVRRKLRAAEHRGNTAQATGLRGWCQSRIPMGYATTLLRQFDRLARRCAVHNMYCARDAFRELLCLIPTIDACNIAEDADRILCLRPQACNGAPLIVERRVPGVLRWALSKCDDGLLDAVVSGDVDTVLAIKALYALGE